MDHPQSQSSATADPPATDNSNEAVRSVERSCALLDSLGRASDGLSLTQIVAALKIPYSTTHRLLTTLSAYGYVERDQDTKRYFLGLHILELQASIAKRFRLLDIAIPHMTKLVQEMSVTCHLAVLHEADVVYLESRRSYGDPFFHLHTPPGRSVPAHCTALGKALLAHLPPNVLSVLLADRSLVANTPRTITDAAELQRHLVEVRLRGYAVDDEEYSLGVRCIAAPIRCRTGEVIAAASVSGSKDQIMPEKDPEHASRVMAECEQVSRELGFVAGQRTAV